MSLTIEFKPHVVERLSLWAEGLDIPVELPAAWHAATVFLELFALDWQHPSSPYYLPMPEVDFPAEAERMTNSFVSSFIYAVQAITQKNNLQAEVDKEERMLADFRRKALQAVDAGNRSLAEQFYKERLRHDQTCEIMRGLLIQATEIAEKEKAHIKREEERIRVRTSKALLLKANLAASVIAFRLDMLQEETQELDAEQFQQNFDAWVQAQRPPHDD